MNWVGFWAIAADGLCCWQEHMVISDAVLAKACREQTMTMLFCESFAQMGVKVGFA